MESNKSGWNILLIVLLAGVLLSTLSYLSSSSWRWETPPEGSKQEYTYDQTRPADKQAEESESKQPSVTDQPWVIKQPAPPFAPVKSCYGVGETVEADGLSFTLRNASVSQYNEKDLVVLDFFIEDISNEHAWISWASFDAFVDDWAVDEEIPIFVPGLSIDQLLSADLTPGKRTQGIVAYKLNKGWKVLELQYLFYSDGQKKIVFCVTPDDVK